MVVVVTGKEREMHTGTESPTEQQQQWQRQSLRLRCDKSSYLQCSSSCAEARAASAPLCAPKPSRKAPKARSPTSAPVATCPAGASVKSTMTRSCRGARLAAVAVVRMTHCRMGPAPAASTAGYWPCPHGLRCPSPTSTWPTRRRCARPRCATTGWRRGSGGYCSTSRPREQKQERKEICM